MQRAFPDRFADADASFEAARAVVLGLPYDATVSFRAGAAEGPRAIRQASWNLETLNLRNRVDAASIPVHDAGDVDLSDASPDAMASRVHDAGARLAKAGKFPVALGGEHSTVPPLVAALAERHPGLRVLQLDAHLDWRDAYEGSRNSHACAARRISEAVGVERLAVVGVRSAEAAELAEAERAGLAFATAWDVEGDGMSATLDRLLARLGPGPVHLTLDIDALDPSFAPGTGTPEPFGLSPRDVLTAIVRVADRLVGFDVNEVSPPWDDGRTSVLAARLVREVLTEVELRRGESA